jgi:hypothetical protein
LAAARRYVWLLGFLVALTGPSLIDPGEAGSRNNSSSSRQSAQQPARNNTNSRQNDRQNDKQQSNRNAKENNRQDDDDDDGKDDASRQVKPATQQQANKNAKENNKQDDDDDGKDDGNGRNDPGTGRSNRATSTAKAQDTAPPDNLVDWWKWITKPASPGPVATAKGQPLAQPAAPAPAAGNKGQPLLQNRSAPVTRVEPTPSPKPGAAEPKVPEVAAVTARKDLEPKVGVGASQVDKGPDKDGRARLPEKAAVGKSAAAARAAVRRWVPSVPPQPGTYRTTEVLGLNLSPAMHVRLRQLNFETRESSVSGLTHIVLPNGLDAWAVKRSFESEFRQPFALNLLYDHFIGNGDGLGVSDNAAIVSRVPADGSVGCSTERCYGRRVIGWRDRLAACAQGVTIGVIDTGYDADHPAFKKLNVKPKIVMEGKGARAPNWHGTGVLSLLAGAATSSTPGLVPDANFLVADAFFSNAAGRARTDTVNVLKALRHLKDHGAEIINMSLVGPHDDLVHELIFDMSTYGGVVFIAAAGNGGPAAPPGYPAAYAEVIAVTAVDDRKRSYDYANRGRYIDVAAPGVRIWTALPDNHEGMLNGTSFAAPFVTAIAAVTYHSPALKALRDGERPLDPKGAMLAAFDTEKLGNGGRNDQYGLGLVKAPSSCVPASPPPVATVKEPPAVAVPWQGDIKRAVSLQ